MKKVIICLLLIVSASQYSCKKFLDITPIDKLTGNNFYQNAEDVEANISDMYGQLFDKYTKTAFAGATGEFRSGEVIPVIRTYRGNDNSVRAVTGRLGGHNLFAEDPNGLTGRRNLVRDASYALVDGRPLNDQLGLLDAIGRFGGRPWDAYNVKDITMWQEYYRVIQAANILVSKLEEGIPALTSAETKRYLGEAKFVRCLCYFTMVRLFGDVVYYTKAFQKDPLPRENMISVINKCIADLNTNRGDLPLTFSDPAFKGVRATQGAAIGLLMNMNMWNAGFDTGNRTAYWEETAKLGNEIMTSGAFRLLPINDWATVVKGRSDESLFELFKTLNYNTFEDLLAQANAYSPFGDAFIHFPYKQPEYTHRNSFNVFTEAYMKKLYPDLSDRRLDTWFVAPYDQNVETFQLKKFAYNTFVDVNDPNLDKNPDNTYLIMRYSDAILLRAEAAANLSRTAEAVSALNTVRGRANAPAFPAGSDINTPEGLKDAIFIERSKELMGEGSHYFDLVRTRRIQSKLWADNTLTADKFARGGWTWPIDESALTNNPYMVLNPYWIGSGL